MELYPFPSSFGRELNTNRIFVRSKDQLLELVNRCNGVQDVYVSIYPFSTPRIYDDVQVDRVYFDIDSDKGYDPFLQVLKLYQFTKAFSLKRLIVSSGEGYNFYIFTKLLNHHQKHTLLRFSRMLKAKLELDIDPKPVGDIARISRVLYTYNLEARRYCIPIYEDDLKKGREHVERARDRENVPLVIEGMNLLNLEPFVDYSIQIKNGHNRDINNIIGTLDIDEEDFPECILDVLHKSNPTHNDRFFLVQYLADVLSLGDIRSVSIDGREEIITKICSFIAKLNWDDYNEDYTHKQVSQIIGKGYKASCRWAKDQGVCGVKYWC